MIVAVSKDPTPAPANADKALPPAGAGTGAEYIKGNSIIKLWDYNYLLNLRGLVQLTNSQTSYSVLNTGDRPEKQLVSQDFKKK